MNKEHPTKLLNYMAQCPTIRPAATGYYAERGRERTIYIYFLIFSFIYLAVPNLSCSMQDLVP